jgi:hypothetical protein
MSACLALSLEVRPARTVMMSKVRLPTPLSGGVMLSYKCSAACKHCMYACSPGWDADWISEADLARGLAQLAPHIAPSPWGRDTMSLNHGLHFTGGEPFLNFPLLLRAFEMAHDLGIPSLFCETNGYWCRDDEIARERLNALRVAGCRGILISVNPFYAEYVPFERTERCIRASGEVFGPNVMVYQAEYYCQFKQLGVQGRMSLDEYQRRVGGERLADRVELFLMGRAARQLRDLYPTYPARRFYGQPCRPQFLRGWHNHFDNYGNLVAGYCGGLSLGSWFELDALLEEGIDPEVQPVLGYLVREDIAGLHRFARDHGYESPAGGYLSKCDLCLDLRTYLSAQNGFSELAPRAFYAHLGDQ